MFFFSSRRRHTRYIDDWSSDVCSSDLDALKAFWNYDGDMIQNAFSASAFGQFLSFWGVNVFGTFSARVIDDRLTRSEERRVGKECRHRRSAHHEKKKQDNTKGQEEQKR